MIGAFAWGILLKDWVYAQARVEMLYDSQCQLAFIILFTLEIGYDIQKSTKRNPKLIQRA